jgi:hypothetical protein
MVASDGFAEFLREQLAPLAAATRNGCRAAAVLRAASSYSHSEPSGASLTSDAS